MFSATTGSDEEGAADYRIPDVILRRAGSPRAWVSGLLVFGLKGPDLACLIIPPELKHGSLRMERCPDLLKRAC